MVGARLERFAADQDPGTVLDPEAIAEVAALLGVVPDPAADLEIAHVAGWLHWTRYQVLPAGEDQEDLTAALALFAPVYQAFPDRVPEQVRAFFDEQRHGAAGTLATLHDRAVALLRETLRTGDRTALNDAIDLLRQAVEATPTDHPDRAGRLSNLGGALQTRYQRTGQAADLDEAITTGQAAVDTTPTDHPDRAMYLSNLGGALQTRYQRTGQIADLNDAITTGQAAVDTTPTDHPDRAAMLSNLGTALQTRYERTGQIADLDEAITTGQAAVDTTPTDHPDRAGYLSNLGLALRIRYERTGQVADLDEAITTGQAAVDTTPTDRPNRAMYLSNLGNALRTRYKRTGQIPDLNEAITTGQAAVDTTPTDHPNRAGRLSNLGFALQTRYERTGQVADLNEAITTGQAAVDTTPTDHPDRAARLSNLGLALRTRYERTGQIPDLNEAITTGQAAVDTTPTDHPNRAMYLSNLGTALQTRYQRTGQIADLNEAIEVYRKGVGVAGASPRRRAVAARGWGRTAAGGGRWEEAVAGFTAAIELLGLVAPRSLARPDQEALLVEFGGLGADAAACCVRAGQVGQAVTLFEQGRGVLLGQALDMRTDLTSLNQRYPDQAASFVQLRDVLDQADGPAVPDQHRSGQGAVDPAVAQRQAAGVAIEELIATIRRLDGFETFLQPPPLDDLLTTAAQGPVVAVAVSEFGSQALLLTDSTVEAVALPGLTPQAVYDQVVAFLGALAGTTSGAAQRRLVAVLDWLWDVLAGPVLDRLHLTRTPADGPSWPRLWWCTTGLLSFLPVHAAGRHDTRFDTHPATVLDRTISSYTPTLRALTHARRTSPTDTDAHVQLGDGKLVAICMPQTPGARNLPGALAETTALQARFPAQIDVLTGEQATRQAVLDRLPTARWTHFACHGTANPTDPSQSQLLLADQPLTVLDLTRRHLHHAQLAFLSACETARPGARLSDEAIHLASAFQLAGYRHVIATLWPINDTTAVDVAGSIYAALADSTAPAAAVHQTVRNLRDYLPRAPSVWASHLHTGA